MINENTVALAKEAARLVRQGWCQHSYSKDKDGNNCWPGDENAVCFCATGAVMRGLLNLKMFNGAKTEQEVTEAFGLAVRHSMIYFNDCVAQSQDEVAVAFDKAADLLAVDKDQPL